MESSDEPRRKPRQPSPSSTDKELWHSAIRSTDVDNGASPGGVFSHSRRPTQYNYYSSGGASPVSTSRYGAFSPSAGYYSDSNINLHKVNARPKPHFDKQPKTDVRSILQSPQASLQHLDTHPVREAKDGGHPENQGPNQQVGDTERRQVQQRRRQYSPTASVSSWNKSRSSIGGSSVGSAREPDPATEGGKRPPASLVSPPPSASDGRTSQNSPSTGRIREVNRQGGSPKAGGDKTSSIAKDIPRLSPVEAYPPPTLPTMNTDRLGSSETAPTNSSTYSASAGNVATEELRMVRGYQVDQLSLVQAGHGDEDEVEEEEEEEIAGQIPRRRGWMRCKCCCTLSTILLLVVFIVFVSVWTKVVSPLHSTSHHSMGFCETTKVNFNSITSGELTIKPDIGDPYYTFVSYESCHVNKENRSHQVTVTPVINKTNVNKPGLTRHAFMMEKEHSMINITVCAQNVASTSSPILYFAVFKSTKHMYQWENERIVSPYPPSCKDGCIAEMDFNFVEGCTTNSYTDDMYCSGQSAECAFSGNHFFSTMLSDPGYNATRDIALELNITMNVSTPRYLPRYLKRCHHTYSTTTCHIDFATFPKEVARRDWCVFLNVTTFMDGCDSGILPVECVAHRRSDIIGYFAGVVLLVTLICLILYGRLIVTALGAMWRHRYIQTCRDYARLL